jgi:hypothetical protein
MWLIVRVRAFVFGGNRATIESSGIVGQPAGSHTDPSSRGVSALASVATVVSWLVVIPVFNVVIPLAFQTWNEISLIAFFGEVPSPEDIHAQHWKLDVARGSSIIGIIAIATAIVALARLRTVRKNLFFALGVSLTLTILWLVVNR